MPVLLAIDTSGRSGGIAVASYDGEYSVVLAESEIAGGTFSAELIPQIDALLSALELAVTDVAAIGVVTGPGSFTGLRIGLAAVKGICEVRPVPVVPVSMLELIASVTETEEVVTLLDAGRSEAYVGRFTVREHIAAAGAEEVVAVNAISRARLMLTPDASIASAIGTIQVPRPSVGDLAQYAVRKLARGAAVSADALDAHYIRRSDAELFSKPASSPSKP